MSARETAKAMIQRMQQDPDKFVESASKAQLALENMKLLAKDLKAQAREKEALDALRALQPGEKLSKSHCEVLRNRHMRVYPHLNKPLKKGMTLEMRNAMLEALSDDPEALKLHAERKKQEAFNRQMIIDLADDPQEALQKYEKDKVHAWPLFVTSTRTGRPCKPLNALQDSGPPS